MTQKTKKASTPSQYDNDFKAALRVLERAAKRAKETARRSKTPLALWQNGRVKTVQPGAKTQKNSRS
jgi:hypothetical protein